MNRGINVINKINEVEKKFLLSGFGTKIQNIGPRNRPHVKTDVHKKSGSKTILKQNYREICSKHSEALSWWVA